MICHIFNYCIDTNTIYNVAFHDLVCSMPLERIKNETTFCCLIFTLKHFKTLIKLKTGYSRI